MPIPFKIASQIIAYILKTSPKAYRAGRVVQKYITKKFGKYIVEIERRDFVGIDGGISQVLRFKLNNITQEAWHVVIKSGKIIHKHILNPKLIKI
ncbi:MAG: hypothetical protein AAB338_01005 [Patescibacteria group bacterium]